MTYRTGATDPLEIAHVIPPGTGGRIGMTFCPGKYQPVSNSGPWARDLDTDLTAIQAWGATHLVTLNEWHELEALKVADLPQRLPKGITWHHLPLSDGTAPDANWDRQWQAVGPLLRTALREGASIVIHCKGGLGRTGTLAAKLLVEFGVAPAQAVERVKSARKNAIENKQQIEYVLAQEPVDDSRSGALVRPHVRITPERASRYRGCLLGGAVGDALGAPIEFLKLSQILGTYGPSGLRDFVPAYGKLGAITDDTQMTLFTAEGALRFWLRGITKGISTPEGVVSHALLRWLLTQGEDPRVENIKPAGILWRVPELRSRRAPGNTCLSALKSMSGLGNPTLARNESKGCGGVMRAAPMGLLAHTVKLGASHAFEWGAVTAGVTHGHPTGQLAAGAFSYLICELVAGKSLHEAVAGVLDLLATKRDHDETSRALGAALGLARDLPTGTSEALARLGEGWVAEEALAIAVYCALVAPNVEEGIVLAVNHSGDSDSTGAMAGNLLGAWYGYHEIPERWLEQLELRSLITEVADDLASIETWNLGEFDMSGWIPGGDSKYWWDRYPGW